MATRTSTKKQDSVQGKPETAAIATLAGPIGSTFATEPNSPFPDGYSVAGEEKVLAEFIAAGADDESDPLYERYIELVDRKDRLEKAARQFKDEKGAEVGVTRQEARGIDELGSLVNTEVDQMEIHTKEAYRLFMGRRFDPVTKASRITGGRRASSALRSLWILTRSDNPYADWGLLRHEKVIGELHERLGRETKKAEAALAALKQRGLTFSVLKSSSPRAVTLGFKSPYGYAVSRLISDYDYFVRLQKTLARKTLKSDQEARSAIAGMTRPLRALFNETVRYGHWLMREEVWELSRNDFLPGASEDAKKRVQFVTQVFGPVPGEVFSAELQPRHSQRHFASSEAERNLLKTVAAEMDAQAHAEEASDGGEGEEGLA